MSKKLLSESDPITCNSSSEDEEDVYVNSVARLKALTNDDVLHLSSGEEEEEEECTITIPSPPSPTVTIEKEAVASPRRTRATTRRLSNKISPIKNQNTIVISNTNVNIDISADNDDENDIVLVESEAIDNSLSDEENYDITVKILWRSKTIHRVDVHRNESFEKLFQYFADLEKVPIQQILITRKGGIINITDTPASINLLIIDILEGGIVDPDVIVQPTLVQSVDKDICNIKVQTATSNKPLLIPLKKSQPFKVIFQNCAKELNIQESSIKLLFDGEQIDPKDTPESLDLEDEACFDLRTK